MIWIQLALGALTASSLFLTGNKRWQGWLVAIIVNACWWPYYILTDQWGLLPMQALFLIMILRNLIKWRREAQYAQEETTPIRLRSNPQRD